MKWIVKIEQAEGAKKQRIEISFDPLSEKIHVYGQCKVDNMSGDYKDGWVIFSHYIHAMKISLEELQEIMEKAVVTMRERLVEYYNLDNGFSVLKIVGFEDDTTEDLDSQQLV